MNDMQRLHILIPAGSPVRRLGDDIVTEARVVEKGADDVERELGDHSILFRGSVMAAHGTDAERMEGAIAAMAVGFTTDAFRDDAAGRYDVSAIREILRDGPIPSQDPDRRLIEELKQAMARDGEATIFPEDLQRILAMIGDEA